MLNSRARYLSISALLVIVGIIMSGPAGMLVVQVFGGQPPWQNARVFVENYSSIQALPFVFVTQVGKEEQRPLEVTGIALSAIFGALIFLNYLLQVVYVPNALDQSEIVLSLLAMANPKSLTWAIEMFGYGVLGLATLVVAPLFSNRGLQKYIKYLLILNGIVSIVGVGIAAVDLSWVLSAAGLISYVAWNILILVIMVLVIIEFRFGATTKARRLLSTEHRGTSPNTASPAQRPCPKPLLAHGRPFVITNKGAKLVAHQLAGASATRGPLYAIWRLIEYKTNHNRNEL